MISAAAGPTPTQPMMRVGPDQILWYGSLWLLKSRIRYDYSKLTTAFNSKSIAKWWGINMEKLRVIAASTR
jgi:hypothetical protein